MRASIATALMLGLAMCTACDAGYEAEGNKLKVSFGEAPLEIRTTTAKILRTCRVPVSAVTLLPPHGPWAKGWSIQLPLSQATSKTTDCIDQEISRLNLKSQISWSEEPPTPPPSWQMKEEFLLIAAERRIPDPAGVPPVPDARTVLPKVLHSCGLDAFREEEISEGVFALRFSVTPRERTDRISCVQREQPRGAWVEPDF